MGLFGRKKSKEPNLQEMVTQADVTQADVELLVAGLGREDVRKAASSGLRPINSDPRVVTALIAALKDDDDDVCTGAAAILATSRSPRAVEPLIAALEDGGDGVRLGAAIAVGTVVASTPGGNPRASAALKSALDAEEDPSLKDVLKVVVATAEEAPDEGSTPDIGIDPYAPFAEDPVARDAWLRIATAIASREPGGSEAESSSPVCYLCGSSSGGRWLDEATTEALRQPDKLFEFYALWDLRRGNFGPADAEELPRQEARLEKLKTSKKWYLCDSCWPDS